MPAAGVRGVADRGGGYSPSKVGQVKEPLTVVSSLRPSRASVAWRKVERRPPSCARGQGGCRRRRRRRGPRRRRCGRPGSRCCRGCRELDLPSEKPRRIRSRVRQPGGHRDFRIHAPLETPPGSSAWSEPLERSRAFLALPSLANERVGDHDQVGGTGERDHAHRHAVLVGHRHPLEALAVSRSPQATAKQERLVSSSFPSEGGASRRSCPWSSSCSAARGSEAGQASAWRSAVRRCWNLGAWQCRRELEEHAADRGGRGR